MTIPNVPGGRIAAATVDCSVGGCNSPKGSPMRPLFNTFYREKMMDIELIKSTLSVDPEIAAELDGLTVEECLDWWGLECIDYKEED
tara:strand:+ start:93 stop:353 length:261 start_codon:yes stop_codon:yes gene_type:complete